MHPLPEQSPGRQHLCLLPSHGTGVKKEPEGNLTWEVPLQGGPGMACVFVCFCAQCSQELKEAWFRLSTLTLLFPQLALSPSPRNPAEPIAVQNNQQLALKVEGVVQHGSKPGLFRRIQSVCLSVSSTLQSKSSQDYKVTRVRKNCVQRAGPRWGSPLF